MCLSAEDEGDTSSTDFSNSDKPQLNSCDVSLDDFHFEAVLDHAQQQILLISTKKNPLEKYALKVFDKTQLVQKK